MEWNRGQGQDQSAGVGAARPAAPAATKKNNGLAFWKGLRIAQVVLLFSATALIIAVVWFLALGGGGKTENGYVDKKKLQAVFLNGGQVYFGNIGELNGKFLSMSNIYYLRVNQQVQPNQEQSSSNDISLVKLGCELHGPTDKMVINREQVIFWENLKDDGQVAKAVAEYVKQNPNGQKCETTNTQSSNTGTTNNTTNTTNTTTTPTNTNTTNNKKTTN